MRALENQGAPSPLEPLVITQRSAIQLFSPPGPGPAEWCEASLWARSLCIPGLGLHIWTQTLIHMLRQYYPSPASPTGVGAPGHASPPSIRAYQDHGSGMLCYLCQAPCTGIRALGPHTTSAWPSPTCQDQALCCPEHQI